MINLIVILINNYNKYFKMIKYEQTNSSAFEHNKRYCQNIENHFKDKNINYSGYCNAFGYEIQSGWQHDGYKFHLKIKKEQSTQNGVIIPVDALEQTINTLKIDGLDKKICINCGRSNFKRFLMKSTHREHISKPFFLSSKQNPDSNVLKMFSALIADYNVLQLSVSGGKLLLTSQMEIQKPMNLTASVQQIINGWK